MSSDPQPAQLQLLKVKEAAERLRVSPRTLWAMVAAGRLAVVRLGRRSVRVDARDLERLVELSRDAPPVPGASPAREATRRRP